MIHSLRTQSNSHGNQVSKEELLRYVESQFNVADGNHDGYLDIFDLELFLGLLSHPKIEKRDSQKPVRLIAAGGTPAQLGRHITLNT